MRYLISAVLLCFTAAFAADAGDQDVLARLKALEEQNKVLAEKLEKAQAAKPDALSKAIAASDAKLGAVIAAPDKNNRPLKVGGYFDISYQYNINRPDNQRNNMRVFDNDSNGFNVHLAELTFERLPTKPGEAGFRVDTAFGTDTHLFSAQDNSTSPAERAHDANQFDLHQAYVEYIAPIGHGITLDFGKMQTMHGAEVAEAADDINASRSILFGYAQPATHTGVRASYDVFADGKWVVLAGIFNGWDNIQDQNDAKTGVLQSIWKPTKWFTLANGFMFGDEQTNYNLDGTWTNHDKGGRFLADTVATFTPWNKWTFAINADYANETDALPINGVPNREWWGVAVYTKYQLNKNWYVANRTEYFDDKNGARTGIKQQLWETTMTADWALSDPMHIRFEYRHDESDRKPFMEDRRTAHQDTLMMQWLYKF
jgi:hypothetical protein